MRVLGIDQASKLAFSVFEDGKLLTYGFGDFTKYEDATERINEIKLQIIELINIYEPDLIGIEDCQMQFNPQTFKFLSMLQGVLRDTFYEMGIPPYKVIPPSTWRKTCKIKGRKRVEQKANAITFVENVFGITGSLDDIAEAICIGYHLTKIK